MFSGLLNRSKSNGIKVPQLNLYPEDPFYQTIPGMILRWAVSAGRHIVIFTELVVIGSFLSRFVLDRQLTDLNSAIVQKQAIVESYGTLEQDFRAVQRRTDDIALVLSTQGRWQVLDTLTTVTPPGVVYERVTLSADRLSLQGKASSNETLALLLQAVQAQPDFGQVSMGEIRSGDHRDEGILFTLAIGYQTGLPDQLEIVSGGAR